MDDVYVIYVDNFEEYTGYRKCTAIGYTDTEQKAQDICQQFLKEAAIDRKIYESLFCECYNCISKKKYCSTTTCDIRQKMEMIERKDIHAECYEVGTGVYFYKKIKRI